MYKFVNNNILTPAFFPGLILNKPFMAFGKRLNSVYQTCQIAMTVLLLVILLFPLSLYSQEKKKIELIDGENMMFDRNKSEEFTRIIGNVIFKHEGMLLYCDSAYLYTIDNSLDAFSNVHIKVNDSTNIYGDSLRYIGNERIAELHKNVKLIDNEITLTTDHLVYDMKTNTGQYYEGGKIEDPDNTLTSIKGYYYSEKKDFFFKDSVKLVNKDYTMWTDSLIYNTGTEEVRFIGHSLIVTDSSSMYCEKGWCDTKKNIMIFSKKTFIFNGNQILFGDSIYYDKNNGIGIGYQNTALVDTLEKTIVKGNNLKYFAKLGLAIVTDSALLVQYEEADTLWLHADTLRAVFDTSTRKIKQLFAYNHTRFFRDNIQGICDSLVYNFQDSTISLFTNPVIWTEKNQLFADTIKMQLSNNIMKQLFLYNASFVISIDDSAESLYNQIKGKNMIGVFDSNELKRIYVYSKSETIYFLREDDGSKIGTNKAIAEDLIITVSKNELEAITFIKKPEATLYPNGELKAEDLLLKNFKWLGEKRPRDKFSIFFWK
jgi:lipopolysaccharide export system protein LptA